MPLSFSFIVTSFSLHRAVDHRHEWAGPIGTAAIIVYDSRGVRDDCLGDSWKERGRAILFVEASCVDLHTETVERQKSLIGRSILFFLFNLVTVDTKFMKSSPEVY